MLLETNDAILQGLGLVQAAATKSWPKKAEKHPEVGFRKIE